ncbi:hypothetical protein QZH41_019853, partial [Actinostola sp. cb2023]
MILGSRVVRGRDWICGDQDGGEGSVGTVVSLTEFDDDTLLFKGTVLVCWDVGIRAGHRVGLDGCYDLRILDSAPSGVVFTRVTCDGCGEPSIHGTCWHCSDCPDYDLCTTCYMNDEHILDHTFICKLHENHQGVWVGKRSSSVKVQAKGIFPGAHVMPISEAVELGTGTVFGLSECDVCTVYWDEIDQVFTHNLGHNGEVELKLVESADGPMYYRDHLPLVVLDHDEHPPAMGYDIQQDEEPIYSEDDKGSQEPYLEEGLTESNTTTEELEIGDRVTLHRKHDVAKLTDSQLEEINVAKIPRFRIGDVVRLTDNVVALIKLQDNDHKGFNNDMEMDLNALGIVEEINEIGTAKVQFDGHSWWFNPAALNLESKEEERGPPEEPNDSVDDEAAGGAGQIAKVPNKGNPELLVSLKDGMGEVVDDMVNFVAEDILLKAINKGYSMWQNVQQGISNAAAKNTVRILKEEYPDAFKVMPPTEPEKLPAQENSAMPRPFQISMCRPMDDPIYTMKSSPRGLLAIINIETFAVVVRPDLGQELQEELQEELTDRTGSEKDVNELVDLFGRYLDFKVQILRPKTRFELLKELREISKNEDYGRYDCFAVCIMSHGKEDFFYTADGRETKVSQVYSLFTNSRCEIFRDKPKLFFIQACRGPKGGGFPVDADGPNEGSQSQAQAHSKDPIDMADILFAYSSF